MDCVSESVDCVFPQVNGQVLSNLTHYEAYKVLSDASEQQPVCELVVYRESPDSPDRTNGGPSPAASASASSSDATPAEPTNAMPMAMATGLLQPTPTTATQQTSQQQQAALAQSISNPSQSQSSPSSSQSRSTRTGEPAASDARTLQQQVSCASPPPGYDVALTRDVLRVEIHKRPNIQLGIKLGSRRYAN